MGKLFASEMAERVCSDGDPDPRRLRLRQRLPGRAHLPRRSRLPDLRGHERRAEDPDRAGARLSRIGADADDGRAPRSRGHAARGVRDGAAGEPELDRRGSALGRPGRARGGRRRDAAPDRVRRRARRPRAAAPRAARARARRAAAARAALARALDLVVIALIAFVARRRSPTRIGGGRASTCWRRRSGACWPGTRWSTRVLLALAARPAWCAAVRVRPARSCARRSRCCACACACRARRPAAAPARCAASPRSGSARSGGLSMLRAETLLHAGAAALALGLIAGLYARGLVLDYRVAWESTLLDRPTPRTRSSRRCSARRRALCGIALPDAADVRGAADRPTASRRPARRRRRGSTCSR